MYKKSTSYLSIRTAFFQLKKNISVQPSYETVNTNPKLLGRILYNAINSTINIPLYDSSHMDGFAVRYDDIKNASNLNPIILRVIHEVKLGNTKCRPLKPGQAARITTGGYLPPKSDTVVPIEYSQFNEIDGSVKIYTKFLKGSFISPAGNDLTKDQLIFKKGHLLRIQDISLLNSIGIKKLKVYKKPKVAIIPTGSELTNDINEVTDGKILNTNGQIISTLIEASGGIPVDLGITSDNVKMIKSKINNALSQNDIVLTIGGSSVGHKDLIAETIKSMGNPGILSHGIKLDRGRVTKIAALKFKPIIILPGPIQGAINAFIVLVLPLIRSLIGLSYSNYVFINAQITDNWKARKKFQNFVKILFVRLLYSKTNNSIKAEPITGETSNMTVITRANGYVIVPEKITNIEKGNNIQVNLLPGFSFASSNPIDLL